MLGGVKHRCTTMSNERRTIAMSLGKFGSCFALALRASAVWTGIAWGDGRVMG